MFLPVYPTPYPLLNIRALMVCLFNPLIAAVGMLIALYWV